MIDIDPHAVLEGFKRTLHYSSGSAALGSAAATAGAGASAAAAGADRGADERDGQKKLAKLREVSTEASDFVALNQGGLILLQAGRAARRVRSSVAVRASMWSIFRKLAPLWS